MYFKLNFYEEFTISTQRTRTRFSKLMNGKKYPRVKTLTNRIKTSLQQQVSFGPNIEWQEFCTQGYGYKVKVGLSKRKYLRKTSFSLVNQSAFFVDAFNHVINFRTISGINAISAYFLLQLDFATMLNLRLQSNALLGYLVFIRVFSNFGHCKVFEVWTLSINS